MSLIAAGVIAIGMGGLQTMSALEQRSDAKKKQDAENRIAAAENENAKYAGALEKRRTEQAAQYEPGYAMLADEVNRKPILSEQAIPLTSALIAGEDLIRKQPLPGTDRAGTGPGTARGAAIDLAGIGETAAGITGHTQQLDATLDLEHFDQRKQAIGLGKQYVGS